jgi:magnesium transporter
LLRGDHELLAEKTVLYLRDTYDHAVRIVDLVESYREIATGLSDLYMSSVSNRMNEVMRVLTVVATVFIPLTFLAGIWGMNFDPASSSLNMPETRWYLGYPMALGLMVLVGLAMVLYFRRKGWLGSG